MNNYLRFNTGLGAIEALGQNTIAMGQDHQEESKKRATDGDELDNDPRTFGDDKYGKQFLANYKVGTAKEIAEASGQLGGSAAQLGESIVEWVGTMRGGEDDNEQRHKSVDV
ncbi:hypothetical protein [Allokutzneria oryzae]|uniref:Uncharacterized protein n=1 Tax=Allokutzneria oryzae TaxID=1378989 RepID=A0ABV6A9C9_9PSEU